MVVVWLALGAVLLLVEMHHLAFYAMFGALGSFAAAVVALMAPEAVGVQVAVAGAVGVAGVVAVRPFVSRALHIQRTGYAARGVHGGLLGSEAVTLDEVGDVRRGGHVRLGGERWLAISGSGATIPADMVVVVTAVQGTTLVVWPLDSLASPSPALPEGDEQGPATGSTGQDDAPDGADGRPT